MVTKKKDEVSGWYVKEKLSPEEKAEKMAEINAWYEKRINLNYRSVPVEIPGKLLVALGRKAQEKGVSFQDFIEEILVNYAKREGLSW